LADNETADEVFVYTIRTYLKFVSLIKLKGILKILKVFTGAESWLRKSETKTIPAPIIRARPRPARRSRLK